MVDSKYSIRDSHLLILDHIQEALECNICLEIPNCKPVYQCNNGHIHCNVCHDKVTDCSVCRIKLRDTRNLTAEKILEKCPRPCTFNNYGCETILNEQPLKVHEERCMFKPVQCPVTVCDSLVPINEILKHIDDMNDLHRCLYDDQSKTMIRFDHIDDFIQKQGSEQFMPIRMAFDEHYFLGIFWRVLGHEWHWHVWMYLVANRNESKDYVCTIKVVNHGLNEEISYTGETVPLHMGRDDVINIRRCLTFDDETAKRFCNNDTITFYIDIKHNSNYRRHLSSES